MKTTVIAAAIVLFTASVANAMQYRGTFDTTIFVGRHQDTDVTATIDVTSDGVGFQITSIAVEFTGEIPGIGQWSNTTLDPIVMSILLGSENAPLDYVPGTSIASIINLPLGLSVRYTGIWRVDSGQFVVFDSEHENANGLQASLLVDLTNAPHELIVQVNAPRWDLNSIHLKTTNIDTTLNVEMDGPTSAITLTAIPEPTTSALALAALCLAMSRRRM